MSEDDKHRVKDMLRAGEMEETAPRAESFGDRVMRRHMRRPVGNSERLWKKVDGTDPWDLPAPPPPEKRRGVWAAGRFVRVDQAQEAKKPETSHIPEWARQQSQQPRVPKQEVSSRPPADTVSASGPSPEDRIKEIVARKQAEADAQAAKTAAARAQAAPAPAEVEDVTRAIRGVGSRPASISKTGRIRTQQGGSFAPVEAPAPPPDPDVQHRYAAGRAPPPPRKAPQEIPIEQRRPPRVDPAANASEPIDPSQRRYAAGRAPPPAKKKANDLPIEMRRPPRIGADGQPLPQPEPPAAEVRAAEPGDLEPAKVSPPARPSPPPSAVTSLDDLFGAAQEGRVRVARRAKPTAIAGTSQEEDPT